MKNETFIDLINIVQQDCLLRGPNAAPFTHVIPPQGEVSAVMRGLSPILHLSLGSL